MMKGMRTAALIVDNELKFGSGSLEFCQCIDNMSAAEIEHVPASPSHSGHTAAQ
jgi:hypothetical protein